MYYKMENSKLKLQSQKLLGEITKRPTFTILHKKGNDNVNTIILKKPVKNPNFTLPKNFNGIKVWEKYLGKVLDQGECGSCWAYASVGSLQSRFNIQSLGSLNISLSPERLVLCSGDQTTLDWNEENLVDFADNSATINKNFGCNGNTLINAFIYLLVIGTVDSDCVSNDFGTDNFRNLNKITSNDTNSLPLCSDITGISRDLCQNQSINRITGNELGTAARFYSSIFFYTLMNNEREIMIDLYQWGPISTAFTLHSDFYLFDFKNKIYEWDETSVEVSGHAVQIVGWGVENSKKFWWIKNSWGSDWGINGYFKIVRGKNMCNIENNCVGCIPDFFYKNFNERIANINDDYIITNKKYWEQIKNQALRIRSPIKDSGFGGGDLNSGFSRRIIETRPWINNSKPNITLPSNWSTFVAGLINNTIENYTNSKKSTNNTIYIYTTIIVILFILLIIVIVIYCIKNGKLE